MPRHHIKINIYWKIVNYFEKAVEKKKITIILPYLELTCASQALGAASRVAAGWVLPGRLLVHAAGEAESRQGGDLPCLGLPAGRGCLRAPAWAWPGRWNRHRGHWFAATSRTCAALCLVLWRGTGPQYESTL